MPSAAEIAAVREKSEKEKAQLMIQQIAAEIKDGKGDANKWFHLATAYLGLREMDKAQKALEEAVKMDPKFIHAYVNLGVVHYEKSEFDKAAEYSKKALDVSPGFIPAKVNLAMALNGLNSFNEAVEIFEEILKSEPKLPMAFVGLYQAHQALNHKVEAAKYKGLAEKAGVVFKDQNKKD